MLFPFTLNPEPETRNRCSTGSHSEQLDERHNNGNGRRQHRADSQSEPQLDLFEAGIHPCFQLLEAGIPARFHIRQVLLCGQVGHHQLGQG